MEKEMRFILKGFSQDMDFRVFEFDGVATGSARASFTVRTDVTLARKYGIGLQELPLLCRAMLDGWAEGDERRTFTYGETEMRGHVQEMILRDEAAKQKKARRKLSEHVISA